MRKKGKKEGDVQALRGMKCLNVFSLSKRTTPYLPAFQVWTSDHPHPQNDVCVYTQELVGTNKGFVLVSLPQALEVLWVQVKAMRSKDWKVRSTWSRD